MHWMTRLLDRADAFSALDGEVSKRLNGMVHVPVSSCNHFLLIQHNVKIDSRHKGVKYSFFQFLQI